MNASLIWCLLVQPDSVVVSAVDSSVFVPQFVESLPLLTHRKAEKSYRFCTVTDATEREDERKSCSRNQGREENSQEAMHATAAV